MPIAGFKPAPRTDAPRTPLGALSQMSLPLTLERQWHRSSRLLRLFIPCGCKKCDCLPSEVSKFRTVPT